MKHIVYLMVLGWISTKDEMIQQSNNFLNANFFFFGWCKFQSYDDADELRTGIGKHSPELFNRIQQPMMHLLILLLLPSFTFIWPTDNFINPTFWELLADFTNIHHRPTENPMNPCHRQSLVHPAGQRGESSWLGCLLAGWWMIANLGRMQSATTKLIKYDFWFIAAKLHLQAKCRTNALENIAIWFMNELLVMMMMMMMRRGICIG